MLEIGANLIFSKPNSVQAKRSQFLLFINNRLVENEKIRKTVEAAYGIY